VQHVFGSSISMNITLYTICWNEARMLPYFLRHYERFCAQIVVYDNGSDDGSQEIVGSHPLCDLRHIDIGGKYDESVLLKVKGEMWKESREAADWVICCDIDEFLHHPELLGFLADCRDRQITVPVPSGWQRVSEQFPVTDGQIYDEVNSGCPHGEYSKRVIFNPSEVKEINYSPGCHSARPEGNIHEFADDSLRLLHCKYLSLEYVMARYSAMARRMSRFSLDHGFGCHYLESPERIAERFSECWQGSQKLDLRSGDR
jgi:glycosyltransferase involved in cell wall biosynthesis